MKRNLLWTLVSTLGVILLFIATFIASMDTMLVEFIPVSWQNNDFVRFMLANWWKVFGVIIVISHIFFIIHSLIARKWIWFIGFFIFSVFLQPFYWWFNSEKNT